VNAWPPIDVQPPPAGFKRADILFEGVEQAGPSFQARVFLNNPAARASTPPTPANGYAGAFHVYGHGLPAQAPSEPAAQAPSEPAAQAPNEPAALPITKYVVATDAVRLALQQSSRLIVSVVALPPNVDVSFTRVAVVFDPQ
jgi:hypothetical protein